MCPVSVNSSIASLSTKKKKINKCKYSFSSVISATDERHLFPCGTQCGGN
uniref:Uncharacterized protein n=1 Tax=Octopus bimaculoides TaxID=37653 RepID=A0A0L8H1V4_OCTBM